MVTPIFFKMTPVKSAQQQEISVQSSKKMKITEKEENLLWQPSEEQKEKGKMTEFMRHINKQHNLSNNRKEYYH